MNHVGFSTHLEAIGVLVTGPPASLRIEKKTFFVLFGNVVVHVLGQGELAVQLDYYPRSVISDTLASWFQGDKILLVPVQEKHHSSQGKGIRLHG